MRIPSRWSKLQAGNTFTWVENILAWSEETLFSSRGRMSQLHECVGRREKKWGELERSGVFPLSSQRGDVTQNLSSDVSYEFWQPTVPPSQRLARNVTTNKNHSRSCSHCWPFKGQLHQFPTLKCVYRCWGEIQHMWRHYCNAFCAMWQLHCG